MEREDIKADLKSAYGELKRFGTRLADTGRDWWQQRRTEMNQRYEHEQDERNRGDNRSQEYWQRGRQATRGGEEQENYGLSGRQSPYRSDERRYDIGGSNMRGQQGGHGYTEDYSAGASGRGRQWDDDDEPWRYSQRSYQTGGDAYSPRAADYSGGAYGMPAMGTGSRYTGSAYQGPYGEEYGYGQDEFRTRGQGQGNYGQRTGGRSGYSEYGNAPYGQSASASHQPHHGQQRYGQQRFGERSGYDLSAQYGQSGYGYGQTRSDEMPMGMGSATGNYGRSGYGTEYQNRGERFGQGSYSTQGRYQGRGPRNYTRSDERITEELNERLTDDADIDAGDITVRVSNGMVTLEGTVEDRWMKHRAEDIADSCSGVKDVTNSIRVVSRNERGSEYAGSLGGTSEASDTSGTGKGTGRTTGESTTSKTPHH
ncbi:BON domain-containing protein [Pseudoxanthomonas sp. UTMC 1351]|uniref:BON domain-containing protein n=1 Tax=Pseudoxanthomonas sp. UTMC 1351 TaxID=2695853 RepID=UPI0034CE5F20